MQGTEEGRIHIYLKALFGRGNFFRRRQSQTNTKAGRAKDGKAEKAEREENGERENNFVHSFGGGGVQFFAPCFCREVSALLDAFN